MDKHKNKKYIDKRDLLIQVAKMYYLQNMTQQQIADKLFLSRSNISRLLKTCVEKNVVEFYINEINSTCHDLQKKLKTAFSLRDAIVIPSQPDTEQTKAKLGETIVMYLRPHLKNISLLGVAWGSTLYHISTAFRPLPDISIDVVQMVGGRSSKSMETDGVETAKRIAKCLKGNAYIPYVPFIVRDLHLKQKLMKEPTVQEHFKRASQVDIALVGIGAATRTLNSVLKAGYITERELAMQEEAGAVADICGLQIDRNGQFCAQNFDDKRIGISYEDLSGIRFVIGACVGVDKTDAVLAALKSGLIHVLAIDEEAALSVLRQPLNK